MPRRSPARYLAPLAIVAFLVALMVVISSSGEPATEASNGPDAAATPERSEGRESTRSDTRRRTGRKTYRVRPGDTPSTIAERTGVSLEALQELNPDIDPQALTPGQRLRLRR